MRILVLNSGSSSLKFQLFDAGERVLAHGVVDKIGHPDASITYQTGGTKSHFAKAIPEHKDAIQAAFECMRDFHDIEGVGHRIVHGGIEFQKSTLITDEVVRKIEALCELAPLHNPANLKGILASREVLPQAPNVAVFDTAFHHTLPPKAYRYAIPDEYFQHDHIRRYGFHGISHRYVSWRFGEIHHASRDAFKLITCHLGNGCSVCAIDHGKSVDTSMGFTPLEGLVMGTRSGDLDPGAVLYLVNHKKREAQAIEVLLNSQAGLAGLSGISGDMRDLLEKERQGDGQAQLAIDVFCYRVKKYIGAYLAAMNGADAIIFAGGIGENASSIRARICESLDALGVRLDSAANEVASGVEREIGVAGTQPAVWVIPTDEELLIARDTERCILNLPHE
jgi:acetate kinase